MILEEETFKVILSRVKNYKGQWRKLEKQLEVEFSIPIMTVTSLVANEYTRRMKRNYHKLNIHGRKIYEKFVNAVISKESPGIIMRIADEIDISYSMLARMILTKFYEAKDPTESVTVNLKLLMRNPHLIEDRELAYEVYLCLLHDDKYGNITEITGRSLGYEYECHLRQQLVNMNVTFQTEDDLRDYGYDKTPDIKLNIPFAVDRFVVNWIESKAIFGDDIVHQGYINDQYSCYWNRFGTGLVIYWLGYVNTIVDPTEKRFIVRYDLPTNIIRMNPLSIALKTDSVSQGTQDNLT